MGIPDPRRPHGFVVLDQAATGLDHPAATAELFRLPGGDPDCGVQPVGVDEVGQLTDCHCGCHELATDGATLWFAGGCIDLVAAPHKIWKLDNQRKKVTATIEPGGDVGAPVIWRDHLWMLTSLHLVSMDKKTNRVVERAEFRDLAVPQSLTERCG